MKTMRKVTALILTMVLCVALGVPAFAADSSSESNVTTKTYTFGNIIVTVVKAPNEITPMPLGSDYIEDALASPTARHTFTLERGEGPTCGTHVYNESRDDTLLEASFSFTINGETVKLPSETVEPRMNANFFIESANGEDLVGRTVTTIEALNSDSVRYSYTIQQQ